MRPFFRTFLLLFAPLALASCSDGTGAAPDVTGQWLLRLDVSHLATSSGFAGTGCAVAYVVRLQQSGGAVITTGMRYGRGFCLGSDMFDRSSVFDTTNTIEGMAHGDSLHLVLHGNGADVVLEARLMGDTLAGRVAGGSAGIVGARRYADSVPLAQGTARASGGFTWSGTLGVLALGNGVELATPTDAVLLNPRTVLVTFPPGTYAVGPSPAPYSGFYAHFDAASGLVDPDVLLSGGTLTVASNDGQLVRGSYDVWGRNGGIADSVRVQGEFTGVVQRRTSFLPGNEVGVVKNGGLHVYGWTPMMWRQLFPSVHVGKRADPAREQPRPEHLHSGERP